MFTYYTTAGERIGDKPRCHFCGSTKVEQRRDREAHGARFADFTCKRCKLGFTLHVREAARRTMEEQLYLIHWKSTVTGVTDHGTRGFPRDQALKIAADCDRKCPILMHWIEPQQAAADAADGR